MATKKTIEVKEEVKDEVPVLRGPLDNPLPTLPESERECITVRGRYGIFNFDMEGINLIVNYTDKDGVQYSCDVDLQKI